MKFRLKQCPMCKGEGEVAIVYHYRMPPMISTSQGKCHKCNGEGWYEIEEVKDG